MMRNAPTSRAQRDAALRAELVFLVEAPTQARVARPVPTILAAVLAFGLAGAGTGAAVAATSNAGDELERPIEVSIAEIALADLGTATPLYGTPVIVAGSGETIVDLGERPEGATALSYRVSCIDDGEIVFEMTDEPTGRSTLLCDKDDAPAGQEGDLALRGTFSHFVVDGVGPHSFSIKAPRNTQYALWVSWSAPPMNPEPSEAQRQALTDGAISREEYLAGLDRYQTCMEAAGWSVGIQNRDALVIDYSIEGGAVSDGSDQQCYYAEFYEIDLEWQTSVDEDQG